MSIDEQMRKNLRLIESPAARVEEALKDRRLAQIADPTRRAVALTFLEHYRHGTTAERNKPGQRPQRRTQMAVQRTREAHSMVSLAVVQSVTDQAIAVLNKVLAKAQAEVDERGAAARQQAPHPHLGTQQRTERSSSSSTVTPSPATMAAMMGRAGRRA